MEFAGYDGFLGTRASLMLDVVVVAMVLVLPVLGWSIAQVRYRRRYALHKRVQIVLAVVLLATVALFEVDMRINGWEDRAQASPYYAVGEGTNWVLLALAVHLFFAVTTAALWVAVTYRALRRFPRPPAPGEHSQAHIFWARLAALDMVGTAAMGWLFYALAFAAK